MAVVIFHADKVGAERYVETVESDDPVIRAAFKVAQKAHEGQLRSEATGAPYIVHPIMAYNMLRDFGIENSLTLSAMLLHDALEECPQYQDKDWVLSKDLCEALEEEGVQDAEEIGHLIVEDLCMAMTNPYRMMEGKRSHQVHHADAMSSRVALCKIVDQAASVLDSIVVEDPGISIPKKRSWNFKALDVVKASVSDRERLYYWGNLFKVLFVYNMNMLNALEAGDEDRVSQLRTEFDYEAAKRQASDMPNKEEPIAAAQTVSTAEPSAISKGCLNVQLDKDGKVCGYHILVNRLEDQREERNECAIELMGKIEADSTLTRVTTGTPEVESGRLVRVNTIKPSMPVTTFCALAKRSNAIDRAHESDIKQASSQLKEHGLV